MTSGYNHGNLIKSIVSARGGGETRQTMPQLRDGRGYRGRRAANFLIKAKKNRSYKGAARTAAERREKTDAEPCLNSACFIPGPRELETTFHARAPF